MVRAFAGLLLLALVALASAQEPMINLAAEPMKDYNVVAEPMMTSTMVAEPMMTSTMAAPPCADVPGKNCAFLAGGCTDASQQAWFTTNCAATCGFCGNVVQNVPVVMPPTAPVPLPCVDVASANCGAYANDCNNQQFRFWLSDNCRATCSQYCTVVAQPPAATREPQQPPAAPKCEDQMSEALCQSWDQELGCSDETVRTTCPKTCGVCSPPMPPKPPVCADQDAACPSWVSEGITCEDSFVMETCPKTCGKCTDAPPVIDVEALNMQAMQCAVDLQAALPSSIPECAPLMAQLDGESGNITAADLDAYCANPACTEAAVAASAGLKACFAGLLPDNEVAKAALAPVMHTLTSTMSLLDSNLDALCTKNEEGGYCTMLMSGDAEPTCEDIPGYGCCAGTVAQLSIANMDKDIIDFMNSCGVTMATTCSNETIAVRMPPREGEGEGEGEGMPPMGEGMPPMGEGMLPVAGEGEGMPPMPPMGGEGMPPMPPVDGQPPMPPTGGETPLPPAGGEPPLPPVTGGETPLPPATPGNGTVAAPVDGETPVAPVDGETPAAPVDGETPAAPVDGETPAAPVDGEVTAGSVDGETPATPVDGEVTAAPVDGEVTAAPVAGEVTAAPVDEVTDSPFGAMSATAAPAVDGLTSAPVSGAMRSTVTLVFGFIVFVAALF